LEIFQEYNYTQMSPTAIVEVKRELTDLIGIEISDV
jgi:hypothetical protein